MSHHKLTNRDGFTLPEVIVAIAVLVLVIFSATNLVVSIIRTNAENIHAITAYGLAQEGLEAVRNIRDSNWLLGAKFNGELGTTAKEIWGESFPKNPGEERMYTVNVGVSERPNFQIETVDALIPYTPWKLKSISDAEDEDTVIEKFVDDQSGQVTYRHGGLIAGLGEETPYRRYVVVENISDGVDLSAYRVTSVVEWQELTRQREVRLTTELTDWNQGQL
ncbi:MAG: prepilin-type N-terminal cleavage/methylation domain-containing protein [Candidatus Gracilibacteria bacterium]